MVHLSEDLWRCRPMADSVLAFDIETVPDVEAGKTLYGLE